MARGKRIVAAAALLLLSLSALVNVADAESLFPTYFDDGPMEEEARYGVVSVIIPFLFLNFCKLLRLLRR